MEPEGDTDPRTAIIVAVEDADLRRAMVEALLAIQVDPRVVPPEELRSVLADRDVFVVLNTGVDTSRLVSTAQALYDTWSRAGKFCVMIRTYSASELVTKDLVFRLWRIGPELTVTVGMCDPEDPGGLQEAAREVVRMVRYLQGITDVEKA